VPNSWQLLTDDPQERAVFRDLAATMSLPNEPAAPPNRLRHVLRVDACGRRYYLKTFRATQWKNRLHFRTSAPRAADDAERELRVTELLRARGHGAPRPVAYGRDGAASYYLCAELAGEPLRDRIERGDVDAALLRRVAERCGRLLADGFALVDLSVDHVFVDGDALAVLDLHNAGVRRRRGADRKLLRRVLRRFARSVRGLPVSRAAAMRFAAHLLRAAEAPRPLRRSLITAAQPFGTAARYEQGDRSRVYAERNPQRAAQERALLARVWPGRDGETVLDAPCGAGRLLPFLQERGHRAAQLDGAFAMLQQTANTGARAGLCVQGDALQLPFADDAVDGVVMFRFLHHLPPDAARQAIAEACRVARRFVVVSFFHPCSVHHARRRLAQLTGAPATRFALSLGAVRAAAARHGFRLERSAAQLPFARDLWVAAFVAT